jgi:hypothetical protein
MSLATGSKKNFFSNLKALGLFTRDYDGVCVERLPRIASDLHAELCHLDLSSWSTGWEELTLVEFINAYVDAHTGLRRL